MAQNNEEGIYIAFSSQLSGTYQTAVMMRDQVKKHILISILLLLIQNVLH